MDYTQLLIFAFVGLYLFYTIRMQKKNTQQRQEMMNTLKEGTHVVTIGGLHGIVSEVSDEAVVLDCEGIYLTFERRAIARVVSHNSNDYDATDDVTTDSIDEDDKETGLEETN